MANTYDRCTQRLASQRRYEDAIALQCAGRWNGAIYLGGYAIECSLKSLICYTESKIVVRLWQMSELRYEAKITHKNDCERFMAAVELLYSSIKKRLDKYEGG